MRDDSAPKAGRGGRIDEAYARLRALIASGELRAGEPVLEMACVERFGMSRTPVRAAIGRLEAEGLLQRRGVSMVVHRITADEIGEILHLRRLLEVEAAGRAALSPDRATLAPLRRRFEAQQAGPRPSPEAHRADDDALHGRLAELAGSRLMARMIADLRLKTRIFDMRGIPERFEPGAREHLALIDAVAEGDAAGAAAAMRTHLDNAFNGILSHLTRFL